MEYVVISDKDAGLATELRAPKGDIPVFLSSSGDRTYWNEVINMTASGDTTIHTPASGTKFYIDSLFFSVRSACGIIVKSGTTNLSGNMNFAANGSLALTHTNTQLFGKAINNGFILSSSGDGLTPYVSGWVTGFDE